MITELKIIKINNDNKIDNDNRNNSVCINRIMGTYNISVPGGST